MADDKTLISPIFGIPAGAEDEFAYSSETISIPAPGEGVAVTTGSSSIDSSVDDIIDNVGSIGYITLDAGQNNGSARLDVPVSFDVISQKINRAPGGQQVVDIVVQIEDIAGATDYEFQVVKI